MDKTVVLSIIELGASILIEGVILAMIFNWISDKAQEKQQQHLQTEMQNLEKQNKFDYEQLKAEIINARNDIISEIKERT